VTKRELGPRADEKTVEQAEGTHKGGHKYIHTYIRTLTKLFVAFAFGIEKERKGKNG